jgi:hypothetical protein
VRRFPNAVHLRRFAQGLASHKLSQNQRLNGTVFETAPTLVETHWTTLLAQLTPAELSEYTALCQHTDGVDLESLDTDTLRRLYDYAKRFEAAARELNDSCVPCLKKEGFCDGRPPGVLRNMPRHDMRNPCVQSTVTGEGVAVQDQPVPRTPHRRRTQRVPRNQAGDS